MKFLSAVTPLFTLAMTVACGAHLPDEPSGFETDEAGLAVARLAPIAPIAITRPKLQTSLIGHTLQFNADEGDTGGGDTGGGDTGGGDTGGGEGGSDGGGGGTECSESSEGDNCTECSVDGKICQCCGWTECWEEDGVCMCEITVEEVDCSGEGVGGTGAGPAETMGSGF